jgi:hypothetical protein
MSPRSLAFPPGGDGINGESRCVVRDAHADSAAVVGRVVNAVGDADSAGVGAGRDRSLEPASDPIWHRRF